MIQTIPYDPERVIEAAKSWWVDRKNRYPELPPTVLADWHTRIGAMVPEDILHNALPKSVPIRVWDSLLNAWDAFCRTRGERYRGCTLDNYVATTDKQRAALGKIRHFHDAIAENVAAGRGVLLYGPSGTGKDHLLVALARAAILTGQDVSWTAGPTWLQHVFEKDETPPDWNGGFGMESSTSDVWVLSDPSPPLGALNPHQASKLYAALDRRYSAGLCTWVSMNAKDRAQACEMIGPQLVDRMTDGSLVIHTDWPSYRRPA